jgi:lipid II:glycine glycyltransferase (peptidoglycan interpeptide bridge formation enzyme)
LSSLKRKHRQGIQKAIRERKRLDFSIEFVEDYENLVEDIYPLFLAVNTRAKELKTEPIPKSLFYNIKRQFGKFAKMIVVRDDEKKILAATLQVETKENVNLLFVGLDNEKSRSCSAMYNMLWESICDAIERKCKSVDLGLTNYFVKERFEAGIYPNIMFARLSNNIINRLFRKLMPSSL